MAYVKVAEVGQIPPGKVHVVEAGAEEVALCNVGGQIYAVANVCTHDGGPLGGGLLEGGLIECPRHGARFDARSGKVRALPAVLPIATYPVRIDGADVLVDAGDGG